MTNIELKVRIDNIRAITEKLKKMGAQFKWRLRQKDTYFNCPNGRLKLREGKPAFLGIIFYQRQNKARGKVSHYQLFKIAPSQLKTTLRLLNVVCGSRNIVKKTRELWYHQHTRIHLDKVAGLGIFLELETEVKKINLKQARQEYKKIMKLLNLDKYHKCHGSYSDMLK